MTVARLGTGSTRSFFRGIRSKSPINPTNANIDIATRIVVDSLGSDPRGTDSKLLMYEHEPQSATGCPWSTRPNSSNPIGPAPSGVRIKSANMTIRARRVAI
jgi:hypothetical protein